MTQDAEILVYTNYVDTTQGSERQGPQDILVLDRSTDLRTLVSVSSDGIQSNGSSDCPSISSDGRLVAFSSYGSNLVSKDDNEVGDVFIHDLNLGSTTLISVGTGGDPANGKSDFPDVDDTGRYVVFWSKASNLVENDVNEAEDIFIRDLALRTTALVSVGIGGELQLGRAIPLPPSASADGHIIAFFATEPDPEHTYLIPVVHVFIRDTSASQTSLLDLGDFGGDPARMDQLSKTEVKISGDGKTVIYVRATAQDGISGLPPYVLVVQELLTGMVSILSQNTESKSWDISPSYPAISTSGRFIAWTESVNNSAFMSMRSVIVYDRELRQRLRNASPERYQDWSDGLQKWSETSPSISGNGHWLAFRATTLPESDQGSIYESHQVILQNLQSGEYLRIG